MIDHTAVVAEFNLRREIWFLLNDHPGRSLAELRAVMPKEHAPKTEATLKTMVEQRSLDRRIDALGCSRYWLRRKP